MDSLKLVAVTSAATVTAAGLAYLYWSRCARKQEPATFDIPLLDLGPFMVDEGVVIGQPPTDAQKATAAALHECCTAHGFAHITNFGLTRELEARVFGASRQLFSLPDETKRASLTRINPKSNTGYSPCLSEKLNTARPPDLKEAFNVRDPALHSDEYFSGCPDAFKHASKELWAVLKVSARRYALACAVALGVEPTFFSSTLERMDLCTARFNHYPPCDGPTGDGANLSTPIRVGEHTDFGAFTFLLLGEGAQGLQVKPMASVGANGGGADATSGGFGATSDSEWLTVPPPPPKASMAGDSQVSALVNTGAALARWTNDVWRATAHRVVVPTADVAAADRYSIACFIDPDADAVVAVHPRFVLPGEQPKYPPTTGLKYLLMKLREAQGLPPVED